MCGLLSVVFAGFEQVRMAPPIICIFCFLTTASTFKGGCVYYPYATCTLLVGSIYIINFYLKINQINNGLLLA